MTAHPEVDTVEAALALDPEAFQLALTERNAGILSPGEQRLLGAARVTVCGCGSIGGAAVEPLVRLGVRNLRLADPGAYELNNLNRQNATVADLGRNKSEVAARRARSINPHVRVRTFAEGVTGATVAALLDGADVVIDGVDVTTRSGLAAKALLHQEAHRRRLPLVTGWDMSGTQLVCVYDYRRLDRPFGGALTTAEVADGDMWLVLRRLVPARAVPRDLLRLLRTRLRGEGLDSFPQLVHAADQFGTLATVLTLRLVVGRPVPRRVGIDLHRAATPWRHRVVDSVLKPVDALLLMRDLTTTTRGE